MATKHQILAEIKRVAAERGGNVGLRTFLRLSGLSEHELLGRHWSTWSAALGEAGVTAASFFRPKTDERLVLEAVAKLTQRLRKWPSQNEMLLERRTDTSFPSIKVIRRLNAESSLASRVAEFCADRADLSSVRAISLRQATLTTPTRTLLGPALVDGYVYMMRSGRRYKIGHTNSPSRRHREVRLDLPDPTTLVHSIATDDPSGIETYWHQRFSSKRIRDTEFFHLTAADIAAFKRRKYQ